MKKVFISYSNKDEHGVKVLVSLIKAVGVTIFRDKESIPPGAKWRFEIENALEQAEIVLVFWSQNSSKSFWVQKEYLKAIELGKKVIPLLLDSTSLTDELKQYQYLNLSQMWNVEDKNESYTINLIENLSKFHADESLILDRTDLIDLIVDLKEKMVPMMYSQKLD